MTNSSIITPRGTSQRPATRVGSKAVKGARMAAKSAFAAADLFLGAWPGPRILIYHQIGAGSGRQMDVAPNVFRGHLDWLQSQGRIVGLGDALADADDPDSDRSFVLTFDDGYADFYENAFPLLRGRGLPFTLYLTTGHIETRQPLHQGDVPLTWEMVREMLDSGLVTLGAHTHSHPDLRGLTTDRVEEEIERSNDLIELRTSQVPMHFAYPKGFWDRDAETVLRRHYSTAVLGAGRPIFSDTDPHRIPRVPIQQSDGHFFFRRKVARGMRMEERARKIIKGYLHPPG